MYDPFFDLSIEKLNKQGAIATLKNKILLNDNFSSHVPPAVSEISEMIKKEPIKFSTVIIAMCCVNGWMDVEINLKRYRISKNDIFIITSKQIGKFIATSDDMRFALIAISNDFYDPMLNRTNSVKQQNLLAKYPHHSINNKELSDLLTLYNLMRDNILQEEFHFQQEILKGYVHAFFFKIFSLLLIAHEGKKATASIEVDKQQDIYKRFIDEVQKHYTQERSIKFYADLLCISPKYLSQIVYKVSGRFANDHINDHVILEAKALIKSRKYSIQEISEMLNFSTQSFFGRFFKDATGYTPLQFQNKLD